MQIIMPRVNNLRTVSTCRERQWNSARIRRRHWERACRQPKEPLRKVLGKAVLNYTEMITVLTDVGAIFNSRPLTYVGDDIRDRRIITPALLTIGRVLGSSPDAPPKKADLSLSERYRYQQRL